MNRALGSLAGSPSVTSRRQDWQFNWKRRCVCRDCFPVNAFMGEAEEGGSGNGLHPVKMA